MHTPLLEDMLDLAHNLWDVIDSNDNEVIDLDEIVDAYQVAYTLDLTEEVLGIEEFAFVYEMAKGIVGELSQANILKFIREEMKKQANEANQALQR